jgi:competence protein ComEC
MKMIARRPALAALVLLIAGILVHNSLPPRPLAWLAAIVLLLLIALWRLHNSLICAACVAAAIVLVGAASAQLAMLFFPADHISLFTDNTDRLADLEMRILAPPRLSAQTSATRWTPPTQLASAEVTAVETLTGWRPATGRVSVKLEPPLDQLSAGQTIRALGFLTRPHPPDNPGEFDFAAYERRQGILADFRVRRSAGVLILHDAGEPLLVRLREGARRLLADGFPRERNVDESFLRMLLLGDADPQLDFLREDFQLTGAAYQLSISGLHIAILGGFLLLVLRIARVAPSRAIWISLIFVAVYAAVALPSQSGWRALLVCVATAIGWLARRRTDGLQVLAIALIAILLISPADLYDPGLQIGAAAVLSLILFSRPVWHFFAGLRESEAIRIGPRPERGAISNAARMIATTALASAVIWVWVLPLVALYFQQTSPWAIPGGLLLLPLTVAALLAGAGKILLTLICPWLAATWAAAAIVLAELLRHAVSRLAHLPAAGVAMAPPAWWVFVVYYALLLLPMIPWRRTAARWAARLAWIPACSALLALPPSVLGKTFLGGGPGGVRITLLSVGSGQTAIVRVDGGRTFIIDCGSTTVSDLYRDVIHPYLLHEGVRRVDDLFLSDTDTSRISAAADVIAAYGNPIVHLTPLFRRHATGNLTSLALMDLLDRRGPPPNLLAAGDGLAVGAGATLQVLWPPADYAMTSSDCGMVLKLSCAGRSILFPADIGVAPESALLKHPDLLKSDVLIAPRHGSADSSTAAFLRAVNPSLIVCSSGQTLTRQEQAFDQLAKSRSVYRTDRLGAIDVKIGGDGKIAVSTFLH